MEKLQRAKKSNSLLFLVVLMIVALFCTPAFAWLAQGFATNVSVTANIIGSYFEQGDGTESRPYVIARPIQFYYFAWLQNLGFFNQPAGNQASTTSDKKFYFTLGADIDMAGNEDFSYIPPVGTATYPFIGVFDGCYTYTPAQDETDKCASEQGKYHVISNVTVSNKDTDLKNIPQGNVTDKTAMQYLGLFGVVGSMTDSSTKGEIKNFGLDGVTVETKDPRSGQSIIGIVAGFCNGTVEGIGVSNCSVSVASAVTPAEIGNSGSIPDTLSFSLIGYSDETYEAYGYSPISGGSDFGGSIDMKELHTRLLNTVNNDADAENDAFNVTLTICGSSVTYEMNMIKVSDSSGANRFSFTNYEKTDDNDNVTQSYGIAMQAGTDLIYLLGGNTRSGVQGTREIKLGGPNSDTTNSYTISDGNGNFLFADSAGIFNLYNSSTSVAQAWRFQTINGTGQIYTYASGTGTKYRLRIDASTRILGVASTNVSWTIANSQTPGKVNISTTFEGETVYLNFRNGRWLYLNEPFDIKLTSISHNYAVSSYTKNTQSHTIGAANQTFVPLSVNDNGTVSMKNTGYIVSGNSYNTGIPGDARVAAYAMSNLNVALNGSSYNGNESATNNLEVLTRTYNTGGYFRRITDGYNSSHTSVNSNISSYTAKTLAELGLDKYEASREQLHNVLNGSSKVYGLHFMDAAISVSSYVTIGKALINGTTYDNYNVPKDCIDFNLKSRGFVNFFAGTYFKDNNTFFSLHHIIRNGQALSEIKQISKIHGKLTNDGKIDTTVEYIYEYSGNPATYSKALPDDWASYTVIFDTTWITAPSSWVNKAMYYFEIPINEGEYALGSVSGKNGAYLLYLDIGASASGAGAETALQSSIKGIDFVEQTALSAANRTATLSAITDETSSVAVIVLKSSFSGSIYIVRTNYVEDAVNKVRISYTLSNVSSAVHIGMTAVDADNTVFVWTNDPDPGS